MNLISSPPKSSSVSAPRSPPAALPPLRGLLPLVAIVFAGVLTIGIPLPVLPVEVHDGLGFGSVVVGWAVGLQSLVTVATRPLGGLVCDTRGPKTAVMLGLPLAALAGCAYLLSTTLASPVASLAVLFAGRALLGLGESLFLTGTMAWGILRVGFGRAGTVMSWQGIAMYAALGIGAPIGTGLMAASGFRGVGAVTIALPLLALLVAVVLPGVPAQGGRRAPFHRVVGLIGRYGLALSLAAVPFAAMAAFIALDFAHRGFAGAGLALSGFGAGYIAVRLLFGHLPDRYGGRAVAAASIPIEIVGQIVLWTAPNATVAVIGATLTGVGFSLLFPAMGVEAVRRVPPESRGAAVGGFMMFFDLAIGLTGPLVGLVVGLYGYGAMFPVGALACAAAVVLVVTARRSG